MTAGGPYYGKVDPKKRNIFGTSKNDEILSDSQVNSAPKKFSLSGILGLNQTVEINKAPSESPNWGKEFLGNINPLEKENSLHNQQRNEQEKNIIGLQEEIKKLTISTSNPEKNIENIGLIHIPETSEYQVNFLERIKKYLAKNISNSNSWLESFSHKKKKKNYFWSTAKNKKQGGEQYLMSSEHSAARSVN